MYPGSHTNCVDLISDPCGFHQASHNIKVLQNIQTLMTGLGAHPSQSESVLNTAYRICGRVHLLQVLLQNCVASIKFHTGIKFGAHQKKVVSMLCSTDEDSQQPENSQSDQGLHCLLTERSLDSVEHDWCIDDYRRSRPGCASADPIPFVYDRKTLFLSNTSFIIWHIIIITGRFACCQRNNNEPFYELNFSACITELCSSNLLEIKPQIRYIFQPKNVDSFLFLHESICCEYSLEAPRRGASNEYPHDTLPWRKKKKKKKKNIHTQ